MTAAARIATPRFHARRELIVDVGSRLINARGLKGLSLGAVADEIGLGGSSVTYYFRRKDLLAAACYDRALDRLQGQVEEAGGAPGTSARIERLLALIATPGDDDEARRGVANLHELRAMAEPNRTALIARYFAIFRKARGYFAPAFDPRQRLAQVMRTQVLLEVAHMLPLWLARYAPQEHPRVVRRLTELMVGGFAPGGVGQPVPEAVIASPEGERQDRFLDAATRLINERGYRGASVERIAAALQVTKGSFYHHLDAKDDLVLACFRRSLGTIERAQDAALDAGEDFRERLGIALATLATVQFGDGTPLLRSTALAALPVDLRLEAEGAAERATRRFSGMIADGISEGSIAAVDPLLGGQVLMAALNVALELRDLAYRVPPGHAVPLYVGMLLSGLVTEAITAS